MRDNAAVFTWKAGLYLITIMGGFVFGFWEIRIKRELTDSILKNDERVSDRGAFSSGKEETKREHLLSTLPRKERSKLRLIIGLKIACVISLAAEVVLPVKSTFRTFDLTSPSYPLLYTIKDVIARSTVRLITPANVPCHAVDHAIGQP